MAEPLSTHDQLSALSHDDLLDVAGCLVAWMPDDRVGAMLGDEDRRRPGRVTGRVLREILEARDAVAPPTSRGTVTDQMRAAGLHRLAMEVDRQGEPPEQDCTHALSYRTRDAAVCCHCGARQAPRPGPWPLSGYTNEMYCGPKPPVEACGHEWHNGTCVLDKDHVGPCDHR